MALTQAIDRRIRYLRKILPEKMMQTTIMVRQNSKRSVITHRTNSFLAAFSHRLQNQFHVFHGPARHQLAAAGLCRWQSFGSFEIVFGKHRFHLPGPTDPLAPIAL